MKKYLLFLFIGISIFLNAEMISYNDCWNEQGFNVLENSDSAIKINFSIQNFEISDLEIDGEISKVINLPGVFLPNDAGMPNLPGSSRYLVIPQNSRVEISNINYRKETISNLDIAPAPRLPLETEDGLEFTRNEQIYNSNTFYPENFIRISEPSTIRGIDVVMLGITPFQYNPITKELIVYRDIEVDISIVGGNGKIGENRLRSRWWDSIVFDNILNSSSIPEIDYNNQENYRDGAEYLIICPNDPTFLTWADSIKTFRQKQGISTMIVTTDDVGGNTVTAIENYVDNAYNTWSTAPAAVLLLGDYGTTGNTITSQWYDHPYSSTYNFVSDNRFADVDGDDLPDIVFARITAQNATHLQTMITKFLDYERNPPTNANFYDHPITALGWQTERWFQICSEVVGGYFREVQGKNPIRINEVYSGTPSTTWSTATNTSTVVNYFGPSGLNYIPATPAELGSWTGGSASDVVNAINSGSFMLQHRDHGMYTGWGEPLFTSTNISSLTNTNNELPFIFSINCQTGAFHRSSECFTEKFHRYTYNGQNSGALGLLAATEISYSFVNDTFVWGVFDNMFTNFMPAETTEFPVDFVLPAFGNAAGKHFLAQSSWPYNPGSKQITYRLFHHHGDAFLNVYTEVPQNLTVAHNSTIPIGSTSFQVTADNGSFIALTIDGEIVGTADGTGSAVSFTIPEIGSNDDLIVTVTKQNYFRYEEEVTAVHPPEITVNPTSISENLNPDQQSQKTLSISNDGTAGSLLNYDILVVADNASDDISGSTFAGSLPEYEAGETYDITFTIYNASEDSEWLDGATLDFPNGVTVNSSTDFVGGSDGNLISNGSTGNGALISWIDDNGSWGNIYGGESATATVNVSVSSIFSGNMALNWTLSGDDFGGTPHDISGVINISESLAELTLTSPNGSEIWATGSSQNITWNHSGAALANVKLELSTDSGSSYSDIIASTTNDGSYSWNVTNVNSSHCLVRISDPSDPDINDISNAVFRIYSPVDWLTINSTNGSLNQGETDNLILDFDTTGMSAGIYYANIEITSNDQDEGLINVPVILNVSQDQTATPTGIIVSIDESSSVLSWDVVQDAQIYRIYAADSPDGTFQLLGTSTTNSYDISAHTESKKFFYITADNEAATDILHIRKKITKDNLRIKNE